MHTFKINRRKSRAAVSVHMRQSCGSVTTGATGVSSVPGSVSGQCHTTQGWVSGSDTAVLPQCCNYLDYQLNNNNSDILVVQGAEQ